MGLLLKRLGIAVAVFVISGAAVLVATFFFFASLYFWFQETLSPPLAALATAGVLLGFALAVIVLGFVITTNLKRKPRNRFDWLLELLNCAGRTFRRSHRQSAGAATAEICTRERPNDYHRVAGGRARPRYQPRIAGDAARRFEGLGVVGSGGDARTTPRCLIAAPNHRHFWTDTDAGLADRGGKIR